MDVGHRLRVQLVRTDVERGYIDFKRVALRKGGLQNDEEVIHEAR
jgi:hypothetical protein